jgi:2-polyprenyl-6-methoxyphenol hydroxylase-like FAD-dependent oxidoreductase
MEVIRQMGLEDRVRAKSLETYSPTGGIIAVESLAGRELATYVQELNEGVEGFSPTVRVFINQDALEPILRDRALELGATVRNRTEAVAVDQDDDGATVTLRDLDSGDERRVRTRYVVAADGNRSPMRARLGIGMGGHPELSRSITIYFRADCAELLRDRNQGVIYVHNPELRGFFRIDRSGGNGFLVINTVGADVTQDSAVDVQSGLTEERALALLRTAIGTDMPMELVDVANWRAEATCAERLREGRVFLAGDAAHVHSPAGGLGMNTGLQDAANLSWKLAAAMRDLAPAGLLDSYHAERHPVGRTTMLVSGALLRSVTIRSRTGRTIVAAAAGRIPTLRGRASGFISGIGIAYAGGVRRAPDVDLAGGGRLYEALRAGRFVLVAPDRDAVPGDRVEHVVPADGVTRMLVRPDGYQQPRR